MAKRQDLKAQLEAELLALRMAIIFRVYARKGVAVSFPQVAALLKDYDGRKISTAVMAELRRKVANRSHHAWRSTFGRLAWRSTLGRLPWRSALARLPWRRGRRGLP